jgi:hypothetical protein
LRISAGTSIDDISIAGSIFGSEILVGRGREGISGETREVPANPDARIGTITVGGSWFDTSVAVGTFAGSDGVFGTLDDKISHGGNPSVVGTIESIEIGGSAGVNSGSFAGAGIVAEYIRSLSIGKGQIDLKAGPRNDLINLDFKGGSFYARGEAVQRRRHSKLVSLSKGGAALPSVLKYAPLLLFRGVGELICKIGLPEFSTLKYSQGRESPIQWQEFSSSTTIPPWSRLFPRSATSEVIRPLPSIPARRQSRGWLATARNS